MWCTSRASPVSTTSPTCVRVFSRMRWWCTAEVSSSDGIGAHSRVGVAVGEHEDALALGDRLRRLGADAVERLAQRRAAAGDRVEPGDHARPRTRAGRRRRRCG